MNSPAAMLMKRTITDECWVFWGEKLLDLRTIDSMKKQRRSRRLSSLIVYTVLVPFGWVNNTLKWRLTLRSLCSSMTLSFNVKENRKCDSSLQGPCLAQNFEDESRSPNKSSKNHLKENGESFSFLFFYTLCFKHCSEKRLSTSTGALFSNFLLKSAVWS